MPELELSTIASSPGPLAEIRPALDEFESRPHWHVNVHTPCLSEAKPPSPSSRRLTSTSAFGFARQLFFYGQRSGLPLGSTLSTIRPLRMDLFRPSSIPYKRGARTSRLNAGAWSRKIRP